MNTKYPEYVRSFRPKGTVLRLRNGRYLVFRATSKHVPGKGYPVTVIGDMVGWIDSEGFHPQSTRTVDFSSSKVYEYGFTALLLTKEEVFLTKRKADGTPRKDADLIYRSLIVSLSPSSCLRAGGKEYLSTGEIASEYPTATDLALAGLERSLGLPEQIVRLLFTMVGISSEGGSFRTLPAPEETRRTLSVYGIDTEVLRHVVAP